MSAVRIEKESNNQHRKLVILANRIQAGETVVGVCRSTGISAYRLRRACAQLGIRPRWGRPPGLHPDSQSRRYCDVDWSQSDGEIAFQLSCTNQAINTMRRKLERHGLIKRRRRQRGVWGKHRRSKLLPRSLFDSFARLRSACKQKDPATALIRHAQSLSAAIAKSGQPLPQDSRLSGTQLLEVLANISGVRRASAILSLVALVRFPLCADERARLLASIPPDAVDELQTLVAALRGKSRL